MGDSKDAVKEVKDAVKEVKEVTDAVKESGQEGGYISSKDSLNSLPYVLVATLAFISIGGFCTTVYRRRTQNVKARNDDAPPEPGVSGKFNPKKPASTT
jgi:hypothetical protein